MDRCSVVAACLVSGRLLKLSLEELVLLDGLVRGSTVLLVLKDLWTVL